MLTVLKGLHVHLYFKKLTSPSAVTKAEGRQMKRKKIVEHSSFHEIHLMNPENWCMHLIFVFNTITSMFNRSFKKNLALVLQFQDMSITPPVKPASNDTYLIIFGFPEIQPAVYKCS